MKNDFVDIPIIIGGREIRTGNKGKCIIPHDNKRVIGEYNEAGPEEVKMAIDAALKAHREWESFSWFERASVTLKAAELLAKKYRMLLNASAMLGQSKNAYPPACP